MGLFDWFKKSKSFPEPRTFAWYEKHLQQAHAAVPKGESLTWIKDTIQRNAAKYHQVERETGVPWKLVAAIHYMESSLDFRRNLHNGEPWDQRTKLEPVGRGPWNSWVEAAIDALKYDGLTGVINWDLAKMLYYAEQYNGLGYYHKGVMSPYIWSWTDKYTTGLYVRDHVYKEHVKFDSCGVYMVIMCLE